MSSFASLLGASNTTVLKAPPQNIPITYPAFFKPQNEKLSLKGHGTIDAILNQFNILKNPGERNYDYTLGQIPRDYYDITKQTTLLDQKIATELVGVERNGVAMARSTGIEATAQKEQIATSAINDNIGEPELIDIVSTQEVLHENILSYNARQTDKSKIIEPDTSEITGEIATYALNQKYAGYYALTSAMNANVAGEIAALRASNPLALANLPDVKMPSNYNGIEQQARDAIAKTFYQLGLAADASDQTGRQIVEAFENSCKSEPALKPRQQYQSFFNKIAQATG
ncbi:MAG: hypothetical protein V4691_01150, partial [Pseudomonadota bacterium]